MKKIIRKFEVGIKKMTRIGNFKTKKLINYANSNFAMVTMNAR